MSQPLDRDRMHPQLGPVDEEKGEFWVSSPFLITEMGKNLSAYERNKLYLSHGAKRFLDVSFASNADIDSDSRSVVAADFDRDGAPDLLVGSVGGGPLRLFRNRYPQQNRLIVKLRGTESNRTGIGARVIVECGERKIYRDVFAPNGFMGLGPACLSIGIGQAKKIDRMTIRWPTGKTQVFRNIAAPSTILVEEGGASFQEIQPKNGSGG